MSDTWVSDKRPQRKIFWGINFSAISFVLAQVHSRVHLGFGDQLEKNAAGLRSLFICQTWWFVLFVNRLLRIRSAVVNRLLNNGKLVWKQLPSWLYLPQGRNMVEMHVINNETKNLRRQTCGPWANICQNLQSDAQWSSDWLNSQKYVTPTVVDQWL